MAGAAIYQRTTGPTYPVRGTIQIEDENIRYRLLRTWEGDTDATIKIEAEDKDINGKYRYKRSGAMMNGRTSCRWNVMAITL
jgi:hypothetical protein